METTRENRVVVLIDMDCFYCQVEEKLNPELKGKPIAVVQYNPWKGGGIIAVNYVARAMGVTRHMRGDEAKEKCPEIQLPSVPCHRGKADITNVEVMPNTFALGYETLAEFISDVSRFGGDCMEFDCEHAMSLLVGAWIVSEIREAVYRETGYQCSAGIAHNKILAKLVCGMNKPNKQTVLPKHSINLLYKSLPIKKVKHLGGKFGDHVCQVLSVKLMGELQTFTERELQSRLDEKNGTWLYNIARGVDLEPVQARFNPKSIGCCKQLRGKSALTDLMSLKKNPKQMVVSFSLQLSEGRDSSSSRSYNFAPDDELCGEIFAAKALELLLDSAEGCRPKDEETNRRLKAPITFLGISVGKFEDNENKKTKKIKDFFSAGPSTAKSDIREKSNHGSKCDNIIKDAKSENISEDAKCDNVIKSSVVKNAPVDVCKDAGKDYVMRKFFQATDKENNSSTQRRVVETSLDKQESFFAKFLKNDSTKSTEIKLDKSNNTKGGNQEVYIKTDNNLESGLTVPRGIPDNDSNETNSNYSTSTINAEINKSIALFDEDPDEINRVNDMRKLLNSSSIVDAEATESNYSHNQQVANEIETIQCTECGKTISMHMLNTHADYHLALKLRDEERQLMRQEREEQRKEKFSEHVEAKVSRQEKGESNKSIASFFVKLDDSVPSESCKQCGKRVPLYDLSEHLDFHEAQKLNRELNRSILQANNSVTNSVKRKRKSTSPVKKVKVPCKSIDSFF
ncbi:unnamed protein product, partial [Leptidea sinapis]